MTTASVPFSEPIPPAGARLAEPLPPIPSAATSPARTGAPKATEPRTGQGNDAEHRAWRDRTIERYTKMVDKVIAKVLAAGQRSYIEADDLKSAGIVALIEAIDTYRSEQGPLDAWLHKCVHGAVHNEIDRELRQHGANVPLVRVRHGGRKPRLVDARHQQCADGCDASVALACEDCEQALCKTCADHHSAKGHETSEIVPVTLRADDIDLDGQTRTAGTIEDNIAVKEAMDILGKADPRARLAVRLHYWYGMTQEEIAEHMGVCPRTVRRILARGEEKLRHALS